jgi:hypothetical protein
LDPDAVLRHLALRDAARGIDCSRCIHGLSWKPGFGCDRMRKCVEELAEVKRFGEGKK